MYASASNVSAVQKLYALSTSAKQIVSMVYICIMEFCYNELWVIIVLFLYIHIYQIFFMVYIKLFLDFEKKNLNISPEFIVELMLLYMLVDKVGDTWM